MTIDLKEKKSAVEFATNMRLHVSINTASVAQALPFYKALFGTEPTKVRPGYAKFEVAEPPVNFTLNENGNFQQGGTISHFGIQVKSAQEVMDAKERFGQSGLATFSENEVTCCYAVQDKVWVTDADGNNWEVFVVLDADAPVHSANRMVSGPNNSCACATGANTNRQTLELTGKGSNNNSCC